MKVIYTGQEAPSQYSKSLFLAGPSLRPGQEKEMKSWRIQALAYLENQNFDGVVFCPEHEDNVFPENFDYDHQIGWEDKYLKMADCIVFWVPRKIKSLPAFTTNVEFGRYEDSGKIVFGCPKDAEKMDYLKHYAETYKVDVHDSLEETLDAALTMLGDGAERTDGERYVPLFIWKTPSFQSWYRAQKRAGNSLNHAELLYSFRPGYKSFVFLWVLKVSVHIESEDRDKDNEFVLSRTDISSVCLYHFVGDSIMDTEIVLVKEFRSPANTRDGFIRELPGGSSLKEGADPEETAAEEVHEETGFHLSSNRLKSHGALQLAGTLSAHKAHLYSAELSDGEIEWFEAQDGIVHGNIEDSERTFIEVRTLHQILNNQLVDWSTLGMLLCVFQDTLY
jgi:8-oxo-dGTP pyrophosphatase MutT (NUDIX family)